MDPYAVAIAGGGMVGQLIGARKARKVEKQINAERVAIMQLQREQAGVEAQRSLRDSIRRTQAARAQALTSASGSGAGLGSSSIQGGLATATGQQNLTANAIEDNLDYGMAVSSRQERIAQLGGKLQDAQLYSNVGSTFVNNAKPLSNIVQQF